MGELIAEHDYLAQDPSELTLSRGDRLIEVMPAPRRSGWMEGTHLGDPIHRGLFPASVIASRAQTRPRRTRKCRVAFSYQAEHEDELSLGVGDVIEVLGEEEEGWWRGLLNGHEGVFPSNFVEDFHATTQSSPLVLKETRKEVDSDGTVPPLLPSKTTKLLCKVTYPYKAQNEDELSLKPGDIVTVLSREGQDPGWWNGELNGLVGVFPDNFVTLLPTHLNNNNSNENNNNNNSAQFGISEKRERPKTSALTTEQSVISIKQTSQRKSLEIAGTKEISTAALEHHHTEVATKQTTPPVPTKKPVISIKKSPSTSGSSGSGTSGIFFGLKKKLVDAVDGGGLSKQKVEPEINNDFDEVSRRPLLGDVRANRPKAPGRRLPSSQFKDVEISQFLPSATMQNGNSSEIEVVETVASSFTNVTTSETTASTTSSDGPTTVSDTSSDTTDNLKIRPKLREWEKHKAPWLAEMKFNQAKRTNTVTTTCAQETVNKFTSTPNLEDVPKTMPPVVDEENKKNIDTESKQWRAKTPPNDSNVLLRQNTKWERPQTIHSVNTDNSGGLMKPNTTQQHLIRLKTPSPLQKSVNTTNSITTTTTTTTDNMATAIAVVSSPPQQTYQDLHERIQRLEEVLKKQTVQLEDVRNKLQVETEMRMALQEKMERWFITNAGDGCVGGGR